MTVDRWGADIGGEPASIEAWNDAWQQLLHFRGDPVAALTEANEHDDSFVMGPIFSALYAVVGGVSSASPAVAANTERARRRAPDGTRADRAHAGALDLLVAGEYTAAGDAWASLGAHGDFAAHRFAHDVYLHIGAAHPRVMAGHAALQAVDAGRSYVEGMHAFGLNEVGRYTEADELGFRALEADPLDLWARHALAHVFEETNQTDASFALLRDTTDIWADQDLLATHVWWHLALQHLAIGDLGAVLDIFDESLPTATTAFRLCDMTSLLWRAELEGHDVGDRWDPLADRWDAIAERHTCGFLDLHAALTYLRRPGHPGAHRWFSGLDARPSGESELDEIFDDVAKPLVDAFRAQARGDTAEFQQTIDRLGTTTERIGGSNAQRQLITLTRWPRPL